jgi:phage shock protein C
MKMAKKFHRSQDKKMIGGVCGGLAEYFDIDANIVRLIFLALLIFSALIPMVIFYLIAWAIVPLEEEKSSG